MLSSLSSNCGQVEAASICPTPMMPSRYSRNEEADMQKAIGYLYDFKKKLDELHPNCINLIESLLQKPNHNRY